MKSADNPSTTEAIRSPGTVRESLIIAMSGFSLAQHTPGRDSVNRASKSTGALRGIHYTCPRNYHQPDLSSAILVRYDRPPRTADIGRLRQLADCRNRPDIRARQLSGKPPHDRSTVQMPCHRIPRNSGITYRHVPESCTEEFRNRVPGLARIGNMTPDMTRSGDGNGPELKLDLDQLA